MWGKLLPQGHGDPDPRSSRQREKIADRPDDCTADPVGDDSFVRGHDPVGSRGEYRIVERENNGSGVGTVITSASPLA